jgi:dihydroxyacid dehydratase/phosphogluconate dehydratase
MITTLTARRLMEKVARELDDTNNEHATKILISATTAIYAAIRQGHNYVKFGKWWRKKSKYECVELLKRQGFDARIGPSNCDKPSSREEVHVFNIDPEFFNK